MYYIYEIYNLVTQKRYIGLTEYPQKRFYSHLTNLRKGKHTAENILKDYTKYGEDSFVFRLIDTANTKEEGLEKEGKYILKLETYVPEYGYNGNDRRFFYQRVSLKVPDTELTKKIRDMGYRYKDITRLLNLKYARFVEKVKHPETFTEDELTKLNEFLKITSKHRWEKSLWWFQQ